MKQIDMKNKRFVDLAFPKTSLKRIVSKHKVQQNTHISEEALELLSSFLDELAGWVICESEKLATNGGRSIITSKHITDAVKIYFGEEE